MKHKTHRTEIHIETHEIKIIRFGRKRIDAESDDIETPATLVTPRFSETQEREIENRSKPTGAKQ